MVDRTKLTTYDRRILLQAAAAGRLRRDPDGFDWNELRRAPAGTMLVTRRRVSTHHLNQLAAEGHITLNSNGIWTIKEGTP